MTSQASNNVTTHERQNRFEILQHIKKSGEGSHQPSPLTTVGVWIYAYVRGLILACKLTNDDCSNVFSWKPRSVLRNIFITYIKTKSNYIVESVLIICYLWLNIKTHGRRQLRWFFVLSQHRPTSCQRYYKDTQRYDKFKLGKVGISTRQESIYAGQRAGSRRGFKVCATTWNRVCKGTQHVISNNASSICT